METSCAATQLGDSHCIALSRGQAPWLKTCAATRLNADPKTSQWRISLPHFILNLDDLPTTLSPKELWTARTTVGRQGTLAAQTHAASRWQLDYSPLLARIWWQVCHHDRCHTFAERKLRNVSLWFVQR